MLAPQEKALMEWIAARREAMIGLTAQLVNIDSNSYDKAGVDAVGQALQAFLEAEGAVCEWIPVEGHGDALRASFGGGSNGRPAMMLGHRDTVFPVGEAKRRPFTVEGDRGYGPGVADMKAGLVQNAFVLAAFAALSWAPVPVVALFTGDEEIGSPTSRPIIEAEARKCRLVFNSEAGRQSGNVVSARRGGIFFDVEVFGKAAHSGNSFETGRSAIAEIADKIGKWFAMNETFKALDATINVGMVSGGEAINMVAPQARCGIDLRYTRPEDRDALVGEIRRIAETCGIEGTRGEARITSEFVPMTETPASRALFERYRAAARDVGFAVDAEFTKSCADSGLTAALGIPTLCGVGPLGWKAHSPDEYLELDSLVPRAQAVALTIARLAPEG
jgi:glutamate carboxypeptidase